MSSKRQRTGKNTKKIKLSINSVSPCLRKQVKNIQRKLEELDSFINTQTDSIKLLHQVYEDTQKKIQEMTARKITTTMGDQSFAFPHGDIHIYVGRPPQDQPIDSKEGEQLLSRQTYDPRTEYGPQPSQPSQQPHPSHVPHTPHVPSFMRHHSSMTTPRNTGFPEEKTTSDTFGYLAGPALDRFDSRQHIRLQDRFPSLRQTFSMSDPYYSPRRDSLFSFSGSQLPPAPPVLRRTPPSVPCSPWSRQTSFDRHMADKFLSAPPAQGPHPIHAPSRVEDQHQPASDEKTTSSEGKSDARDNSHDHYDYTESAEKIPREENSSSCESSISVERGAFVYSASSSAGDPPDQEDEEQTG